MKIDVKEATDKVRVKFQAISRASATPVMPMAAHTSSGAIKLIGMEKFEWT